MKTLIVSALLLGSAGGLGFALLPGDHPWSEAHTARMRGREAYYTVGHDRGSIAPISVPLSGDGPQTFLQMGYVFTFRRGRELEDANPLIAKNHPELIDALYTNLCGFTPAELDSPRGMVRLKNLLADLTQRHLFPHDEARVDRIYLDPYVFQTSQ